MTKIKLILKARPLWILVLVATLSVIVGLLIPTAPGVRGPLFTVENAILGIVIVALGGFIANLYLDRSQLYTRLGKLEDDVRTLREANEQQRGDLTAAASFINRLGLAIRKWIDSGMPPRDLPKPPDQLLKHGVDDELWSDAIGGTDD